MLLIDVLDIYCTAYPMAFMVSLWDGWEVGNNECIWAGAMA